MSLPHRGSPPLVTHHTLYHQLWHLSYWGIDWTGIFCVIALPDLVIYLIDAILLSGALILQVFPVTLYYREGVHLLVGRRHFIHKEQAGPPRFGPKV